MRNLYEVLGIAPDASLDQIRAAYRVKVKTVHPDIGGSNESFTEVTTAYEILTDEVRRRRYDDTGRIDNQDKAIASGAKQVVESLINQVIDQDEVRSVDVIAALCRDIATRVGLKNGVIETLERRRLSYADLKGRFRAKDQGETFLDDLMHKKIEALGEAIEAEKLALAQLVAALSLLQGYEFMWDGRATIADVDLNAVGRPGDPLVDTDDLLDTSKRNGEKKVG